jgi:SAM-dependent methyltransferase
MSARESAELRRQAYQHWEAGRYREAIDEAWAAYRLTPADLHAKVLLTMLLHAAPGSLSALKYPWRIDDVRKSDLARLVTDRRLNPEFISKAGWSIVLSQSLVSAAQQKQFAKICLYLEHDELSQALLRETPVQGSGPERWLTKARRWLLLSESWQHYPKLIEALVLQASLNGGAWPLDEVERLALKNHNAMFPAYYPHGITSIDQGSTERSGATRVSADYERWPYPEWQRIMERPPRRSLGDQIRSLDPEGPDCIPKSARVLIAGCGTGYEAATYAFDYPDIAITAIDVSEASLNYARRKFAELRIRDIRLIKLDLHDVSHLKEQFDIIVCSGVLHHLPDPERGWEALASVLRPGGAIKLMLYSKFGYPDIRSDPTLISDLVRDPMSDDVVRCVRQRLMDRPDSEIARSILNSPDFATLAGTRDLVLHTEVHLFDVPRIARAIDSLRLRLLTFMISSVDRRAQYRRLYPDDPEYRDVASLTKFEASHPGTFRGMYDFWCRSQLTL